MPLVDHLDVEPVTHRGREMFAVQWFGTGEVVARYDSKVAAWDHACRAPFHEANTLPEIGPGDMFASRNSGPKGKGSSWTSDPRFAVHVPASEVSPEDASRIDALTIQFIRTRCGDVADDEVFHELTEHNTPERLEELRQEAAETPRIESEPLSGGDGATTPPESSEAVESDSEESVHNFLDLAENAPSEAARAYWLARWEALS